MNRIIPGLIWLILWILSWSPGFMLRFFSYLIHAIAFLFLRYRTEVVSSNLSRSLPELSPEEHHKIADRFFQHFSEIFLEMNLFIRLKPGKSSRYIRFSNPVMITEAFDRKKNIIIMAGHYGNWEWNLLPILASGYRVIAIYKPQSSKLADQLMKNIRQKPGILLVPMKDTLRIISSELKENNTPFALLLVADQIPARGDIRFWTSFLHQDTAFFTGAEKLSRRFSLPVYYVDQIKHRFARYEVNMSPVYDGVSATGAGDITRAFARLLEGSIRMRPHLWLWSHRRWKYRREELPLQV